MYTPGPARHPRGVAPAGLRGPRRRHREVERVLDGARTALLREPDQQQQQLGGRLGVGKRTVAGPRREREAIGERGEVAAHVAGRQAAAAPATRCRAPGSSRRRPSMRAERTLQEADVEAGVVGDEHAPLGKPQEVAERRADRPGSRQVALADARERHDRRRQRDPRVDEALERRDAREAARSAPRRSRRCALPARRRSSRGRRRRSAPSSSGVSAGGAQSARPTSPSPTRQSRLSRAHDLVQQPPDERRRRALQREQAPGRVLRPERAAMRVQRIDQPVCATERELKLLRTRTHVRILLGRRVTPAPAARP